MQEKIINDYNKALGKLEVALSLDHHEEIIRDAIIKRFEFTYELAWKAIKRYVEFKGDFCNSPRDCFKKGFKLELFPYDEIWLDMIETRNLTSHTYSQETAEETVELIKEKYLPLFKNLLNQLHDTVAK